MTSECRMDCFKKRYSLWLRCLSGHQNSLKTQIHELGRSLIMREIWKLSAKLNPIQNDEIHKMAARWSIFHALVCFRKLLDTYTLLPKPKKERDDSVYSFISLIKDLKKTDEESGFLSEEYFITIFGKEEMPLGIVNHSMLIEHLDSILEELNKLKDRFDAIINKLIVHAASESSITADKSSNSLPPLFQTFEYLIRVHNFICSRVLTGVKVLFDDYSHTEYSHNLNISMFNKNQLDSKPIKEIFERFNNALIRNMNSSDSIIT